MDELYPSDVYSDSNYIRLGYIQIAKELQPLLERSCSKYKIVGEVKRGDANLRSLDILAVAKNLELVKKFTSKAIEDKEFHLEAVANKKEWTKYAVNYKHYPVNFYFVTAGNYGWASVVLTYDKPFVRHLLSKLNKHLIFAKEGKLYKATGNSFEYLPVDNEDAVFNMAGLNN